MADIRECDDDAAMNLGGDERPRGSQEPAPVASPKLSHAATPGPWRAKVDLFRPPKLFVHAPDSFAVCRVMTAHYHAEIAKANAHLIAAAPELKEAGDKLASVISALAMGYIMGHIVRDVEQRVNEAIDAWNAARAKAEGR